MPKSARYNRCIQQIKNMGGDLSEDELADVADELLKESKRIKAARANASAKEAIDQAVKDKQEDAVTEALKTKRTQYLKAKALSQTKSFLLDNWRDDPRFGYHVFQVGANTLRTGSGFSVDAQQKSLAGKLVATFAADVERTGKWKLFASGELDRDAYRALNELYKPNPNMEGIDKDARQFAEIVYKSAEVKRTALNKAGAWIGRSADYVTDQTHDMYAVRRAKYEINHADNKFADRWLTADAYKDAYRAGDAENNKAYWDFTRPLLNEEKTYKGVDAESNALFERNTWRNIASGDHMKVTGAGEVASKGGSLAGALSRPRVLHFKDGESRWKYDEKFGRGTTLMERFASKLQHVGHEVVLMQKMSPDPEGFHEEMKRFVRLAVENTAAARNITRWHGDEAMLDNDFDQINGKWQIPGQSPVASVLRNLRLMHVVSKLGMMVPSSLSDMAAAHGEMAYQGIGGMEQWSAHARSLVTGYGSRGPTVDRYVTASGKKIPIKAGNSARSERLRQAAEWGVTVDMLKAGIYSNFTAADSLPGQKARLQHIYMKMNGGLWWTDSRRLALSATTSHHLGLLADHPYNALPKETLRLFKLYDIKEDEWNLMREHSVDVAEGHALLNPNKASLITDPEIADLLERENLKATPSRISDRKDEIENKFRTLIAMRGAQGVMHTSAKSQGYLTGGRVGIKPGTVAAEAMKSVMQFKSFPAAIIEKIFGTQIYGYGPDLSMLGAMKTSAMNGGAVTLAKTIAYMTLLGYVGLQIKGYLSGKVINAPRNHDDWVRQLKAAFLQGGGAGIYGDFLFGHGKDRFGHAEWEDLLGPVAGDIGDLHRLIHGAGTEPPSGTEPASETSQKGHPVDTKVLGWRHRWMTPAESDQAFKIVRSRLPFQNIWWLKGAMDYLIWNQLQEEFSPGSLRRMEKSMRDDMFTTFRVPPSKNMANFTAEDWRRFVLPTGR